jgi:hypothetical protein
MATVVCDAELESLADKIGDFITSNLPPGYSYLILLSHPNGDVITRRNIDDMDEIIDAMLNNDPETTETTVSTISLN